MWRTFSCLSLGLASEVLPCLLPCPCAFNSLRATAHRELEGREVCQLFQRPCNVLHLLSGGEEWHRRIISRVSGTQIVEIRNEGPDSEHLLGTAFVDLALSKNPGAQHEQGGSEVKTGPVQSMGRVPQLQRVTPKFPIPARQQPRANRQETRSRVSFSIPAPHRCLHQSCTPGCSPPPQDPEDSDHPGAGEQALLLGRCFSPCQCYPLSLPLLQFRGFLQKRALGQGYLLPTARLQGYKIRFSWGLFGFFVLGFGVGFFPFSFLPSVLASGNSTFWLVKGKLSKWRVRCVPTWRTQLRKDGPAGAAGIWLHAFRLRTKPNTDFPFPH